MASSQQDSQNLHWHFTDLDDRSFQIHGRTLFYGITIFFIIAILTLIFLYARWIYNFHRFSNSQQHGPPHAPPSSLPVSRPQGLDPSVIHALPISLYESAVCEGLKEQKECCICLGEFEDGDKVKSLPVCGHSFHCDCVDRWLCSHSSCPLCRVSLRVESDVLQIVTT